MSLAPRTLLGPYEVQSSIGAGGMGEVYRARDTRLGRDVAIKVLPSHVAADPDAVARFEHEARAVASLSHPNILAIHDVGSDQGVAYAVTELLEGETLRQRLLRSPLPWRKAIGIAVQLADGLAAAHARRIVHRDLKPENIFLTAAGPVKILDFGLARVIEPKAAADGLTRAVLTQPGMILGTVGYMSPEQVRGEEAGPTSDVFSFGCVVYEMLRGAPPFDRPTAAETMTAVLRDDPAPLSEHAAEIPPGLDAIVGHCLEKRPGDRFQSTADLVFALRAVGTISRTSGEDRQAIPARRRVLPAIGWILLACAGGALIAVTAFLVARRDTAPPRPERFTQLTFERGAVSNARFGSDGKNVVFSASWEGGPSQVFVRLPDNPDALPTGSPDTDLMAVSSSGDLAVRVGRSQTAVSGYKGTLARTPVLGGAARQLKEAVAAADWLGDGESLAVVTDLGDRQRLDCGPGTRPYETRGWISDLRVAPHGTLVAFIEHPSRDTGVGHLVAYDFRSGTRTELAPAREHLGLAWHPRSSELWFGEYGGLRAISLGGVERVVLQLPESVRLHDIAPDGRVLLSDENRRVRMALRNLADDRVRDLSWLAWSLVLAFTPDSKKLLFTEFPLESSGTIVAAMRGVDGSPVVRLGRGFVTSVSQDGRWAAAIRETAQSRSELVLLPMGPGETQVLASGRVENHRMAAFVPSGGSIVFIGREPGQGARLYRQALSGGAPTPISPEGIGFSVVAPSPDGSFVAANWQGDRPWLFPLAGGEPRALPAARAGDVAAGWSADGKSVYIRGLAAEVPLRRANIVDGSERTVAMMRAPDPSGVMAIGPLVVAPDERTVAFSYFRALSSLYLVTGLR